jgi:hypothetical protein
MELGCAWIGRPPLVLGARKRRQRETKEVFDLSEAKDDGIRVSMLQILVERSIRALHPARVKLRRLRICRGLEV